jgi:hypothetical protein
MAKISHASRQQAQPHAEIWTSECETGYPTVPQKDTTDTHHSNQSPTAPGKNRKKTGSIWSLSKPGKVFDDDCSEHAGDHTRRHDDSDDQSDPKCSVSIGGHEPP